MIELWENGRIIATAQDRQALESAKRLHPDAETFEEMTQRFKRQQTALILRYRKIKKTRQETV